MYEIFSDIVDGNHVKSKRYVSPKGRENESNAYKKRIKTTKPRNRNFPGWTVLTQRTRAAEIANILFQNAVAKLKSRWSGLELDIA